GRPQVAGAQLHDRPTAGAGREALRPEALRREALRSADSPEHRDEAIDIRLVVVDVRADAQAAEPRRGVDILGGKALDELRRHAVAKAQTQDVRRAHAPIR